MQMMSNNNIHDEPTSNVEVELSDGESDDDDWKAYCDYSDDDNEDYPGKC